MSLSDYAIHTIQPLVDAGVRYLNALKIETELRTKLMSLEVLQQSQAIQELENTFQAKSSPKGLMKAPFGYCPECGELGESRNLCKATGEYKTQCTQGHIHNSRLFTVLQKPEHRKDKGV